MTELTKAMIIALITFESRWWQQAGNNERAISEELELSPVRYYQLLRQAAQTEVALRHDPVTVRRLMSVMSRRSVTSDLWSR